MIQISDKLRVRSDGEWNVVIEELKDVIDKDKSLTKWKVYGYYPSFKSALVGVLNKKLLELPLQEVQLSDIVNRIDEAEHEIKSAINFIEK
jgi:hypothetical protein